MAPQISAAAVLRLGKAFKGRTNGFSGIVMDSKTESWLAIAMGVVIFVANTFWLLYDQSYTVPGWLVAAIIIYIADLVWIWADFDLMRKSK